MESKSIINVKNSKENLDFVEKIIWIKSKLFRQTKKETEFG